MNGAWADGAPPQDSQPLTPTGLPYVSGPGALGPGFDDPAGNHGRQQPGSSAPRNGITDRATRRVSHIRQFEGLRGYSARAALVVRYMNYFILILLMSGITSAATKGVKYAAGGGTFMLGSCAIILTVGAASTLFYVNLRNELVERVRHYVFGIITIPGTLLALMLRALQQWEWINEGSLGSTLQSALPAVFLATVVLPCLVFVKEVMGIRTLHRSRLDNEEAVQLWTRQDGLQR